MDAEKNNQNLLKLQTKYLKIQGLQTSTRLANQTKDLEVTQQTDINSENMGSVI